MIELFDGDALVAHHFRERALDKRIADDRRGRIGEGIKLLVDENVGGFS